MTSPRHIDLSRLTEGELDTLAALGCRRWSRYHRLHQRAYPPRASKVDRSHQR